MIENIFPSIYEKKDIPELYQGDIFHRSFLRLPSGFEEETVVGWILLNAQCDLHNNSNDFFNFAALRPLNYFIGRQKEFREKSGMSLKDVFMSLIHQRLTKAYFFPPNDKIHKDGFYADLGFIKSLPNTPLRREKKEMIEKLISQRLCSLKLQWRDHLSQYIGNYFARLGVPDPDKKGVKNWASKYVDSVIEVSSTD